MNNFRNFSERKVSFDDGINLIIAKNGSGKTNILEALCLPSDPLVESAPEYLVKIWEPSLYVEISWKKNAISFSYDAESKKKKYIIAWKSTTKAKVKSYYPHIVSFHPMLMNLLYMGPSERRSFLDEILTMTFPEYKKILSEYKKILLNRNRLLKNISEKKSEPRELDFWDSKYISAAEEIYTYRNKIISYFEANISSLEKYFFGKIQKLHFKYSSKTDLDSTREYLQTYISENRDKEIMLRKTLRWPHLDDFTIIVDDMPLAHFASRWEVKSILLWLKFLETWFVDAHCDKKEIVYLIDDLLSELDSEHRELLIQNMDWYQSIITSIQDIDILWKKIYL